MAKDEIGVQVEGLHKTGRTISGREGDAKSSATSLRDGIDAAGALLGHGALKTAAKNFVDQHITDHANRLPTLIDGAGVTASNTASTARSADEEGARQVKTTTDRQIPLARPINGNIPQ